MSLKRMIENLEEDVDEAMEYAFKDAMQHGLGWVKVVLTESGEMRAHYIPQAEVYYMPPAVPVDPDKDLPF